MAAWQKFALVSLVTLLGAGCGANDADEAKGSGEDDFTSATATLLEFEFDGELITTSGANPKGQIKAQLLYTVGQLNANDSVARLNKVTLSNITTTGLGGGQYKVRYRAKLPVAWGAKQNLPKAFTLLLPKRVDSASLEQFLKTYGSTCSDAHGHDVQTSNFWYHYRPRAAGCQLAPGDVTGSPSTIKVSAQNTTGKYPEYHRVWEDDSLDVLAVFGKYEEGATSSGDAGIEAYDRFVMAVRAALPGAAVTPANLTGAPGAARPDVTIDATLADGRNVTVSVLLVDRVSTAPASFDARYAELTPGADLILYNGHAGLGSNVAALSKKGRYFPGKYQIVFFNGCDTFAYQDDTLASVRAPLNPDDTTGTRYLDTLANAMPAYFSSMPDASMALIGAMVDAPTKPRTYESIFTGVDAAQVVVATGEEDNVFSPKTSLTKGWGGQVESGTVGYKQTKSYQTEVLPAGKYVFTLVPEASAPGGDADLHVRVGSAPTLEKAYKCPSYLYNSNERCSLTLSTPSKVFFSVTGDKQSQASSFVMRAFAQ